MIDLKTHNDLVEARTQELMHVDFASLPLADIAMAAAEFERALALPGIVGAQVPGNAFITVNDAMQARPILDVANRHRAVVFIHHGPRPGDAWPRVPADADNLRRRVGTLDMQASLSANMVTLCLTDLLADYPNAAVVVHNLGGNIPSGFISAYSQNRAVMCRALVVCP